VLLLVPYVSALYGPPAAVPSDPVLKPEMAVNMAKYMPNLTTAMVEDSGHWALMEQTDKVNDILVEWMATIDAP
jgi:pimeloyl-ACP methyl ester carboxylesterase